MLAFFLMGALWEPTAAHAIAHAAHRSRIKLWGKVWRINTRKKKKRFDGGI